jgi:short-subunit dehydrogenase
VPTALVTGASSGIGRELAKLLATDGYDLVLVARGTAALEELARQVAADSHVNARVLVKDLAEPGAPAEIAEELASVPIDVLINNAGFGVSGPFADTSWREERDLIGVNIAAATELVKRFLPGMLERRRGAILNVASTAAFQPGPLMAVYYASKAYVLSFSEALANELSGSGVTVTALCPGPTITNFQKRAQTEGSRLFTGPLVMDAPAVARAGIAGMKRGRRIVIPGLRNKLLAQSVRFAPRSLVTRVARAIQETRGGSRR